MRPTYAVVPIWLGWTPAMGLRPCPVAVDYPLTRWLPELSKFESGPDPGWQRDVWRGVV